MDERKEEETNSTSPNKTIMTIDLSEKSTLSVNPPVPPRRSPKINKEFEQYKQELLVGLLSKDLKIVQETVKKLKENSFSINYRAGKDHLTLLHRCIIQQNSLEIMRFLLENNAFVDAGDLNARSPLHLASEVGDVESIKLLLEFHANFMSKDNENSTPLHKAAEYGQKKCMELLIEHNALINHQNIDGCTALHLASKQERVECVEWLLNRGADPLLLTKTGKRPIDLVRNQPIKLGKPESLSKSAKPIEKLLKKKGGDKVPINIPTYEIVGAGIGAAIGSGRSRSIEHQTNNRISTRTTSEKFKKQNILDGNGSVSKGPVLFERGASEDVTSKADEIREPSLKQRASTQPSLHSTHKLDRFGFVVEKEKSPVPKKNEKRELEKAENLALKWINYIQDWDNMMKKNKSKIMKMCDKGIPDSVRGEAWKLLAGINKHETDFRLYHDLLEKKAWDGATHLQILRDINRTMPEHILFKEKGGTGQQMLTNVLLAFSACHPEVGYCQGMGFIVAMFLMYMTEEDSFFMFKALATEYGYCKVWEANFKYLKQSIATMTGLLRTNLPKVIRKFEQEMIPMSAFATQFFITGFLYNLPFNMAVRVWDSFWLRGYDYWYAVALSIFKNSQENMLKMDLEQIMTFFRDRLDETTIPFQVDQLIDISLNYYIKIKPSSLRKWELDAGTNIDAERLARQKKELGDSVPSNVPVKEDPQAEPSAVQSEPIPEIELTGSGDMKLAPEIISPRSSTPSGWTVFCIVPHSF